MTLDLRSGNLPHDANLGHRPGDVVGVALAAQEERRVIGLGLVLHRFDQSRGLADADDEHAGGQRIESPRVASFLGPDKVGHVVDNAAQRDPRGLVDIEDAKPAKVGHVAEA